MAEEPTYRGLIERVIAEEFPHELAAFQLEGNALIHEQEEGKDVRCMDGAARGDFGFVGEVISVLKFIGLLWSTYEILKKLRSEFSRASKREGPEAIRLDWEEKLIEAGIEREKASQIAERFGSELANLVVR